MKLYLNRTQRDMIVSVFPHWADSIVILDELPDPEKPAEKEVNGL